MTAAIYPFSPNAQTTPQFSLQTKLECFQKITRDWGRCLSRKETIVLLAIIDRTIGWGRSEAYFSTRSMLLGDAINGGMDMSRSTLFRALATLDARGIISRRKDRYVPDRVHYSVNLRWRPETKSVTLKSKLMTSPDATIQCHSDTNPCQSDATPCQIDTLKTGINLHLSNNSIIAAPVPAPRSPISEIQNPADRIRLVATAARTAHRDHVTARAATTSMRDVSTAVEAAWRGAMLEAFPQIDMPSWGVREKAQAKQAAKHWVHSKEISYPKFVEWAVLNWTAIVQKQFKWMTKSPPPVSPAFGFFIAMQSQFAECRAEGTLENWLSDKDRTQIERLIGRGMTYEQATAHHGKNQAVRALRDEMETREIKARSREQSADNKLEQAKKLAEFGAAPIHPKSPAAIRARQQAMLDDLPPLSAPMVNTRNPFD